MKDQTVDDLGLLFVSVFKRTARLMESTMASEGLSLARTKLLLHLEDGPRRQQALADLLDLSARTITETVDGLERDGLAQRLDDPTDRRAKLVAITDPGRSALEAGLKVRRRVWHDVFTALDAPSRAALHDLLGALDAGPALTPPSNRSSS